MFKSKLTDKTSLEYRIEQKIAQIAVVAEDIPGVIIIQNIQKKLFPEYISPRGQRELGLNVEELRRMDPEYNYKFFNPEDARDYVPKIMNLLAEDKEDGSLSFFQQIRASDCAPWAWYLSTIKVLMRDDAGAPLLTITIAMPVDPLHHITPKVSRLLDESIFLRNNTAKFEEITDREREVLRSMAYGHSASETAKELHISVATVETHRRNIKKKLKTTSFFELTQYARAFDLI